MNKYLAQAIEARSVDREKSTHVNLLTLCFKDRQKESQVSENENCYSIKMEISGFTQVQCSFLLLKQNECVGIQRAKTGTRLGVAFVLRLLVV